MSTLSSFADSPEQDEILRETHFWSDNVSLELSIMNVLAALRETSPEELPPLYPAVDVEALPTIPHSRPEFRSRRGDLEG